MAFPLNQCDAIQRKKMENPDKFHLGRYKIRLSNNAEDELFDYIYIIKHILV